VPAPVAHRCRRCGWAKFAHTHARPQRLCPQTGKVQHRTRAGAAKQLHVLVSSPSVREPERLHVYRCPLCTQWHVGHQDGAGDVATTDPRHQRSQAVEW